MSFGTDFITKPLQEKIDKLVEENKQLKFKLNWFIEENIPLCAYWEPTGCIHPIKETELCECPCDLYYIGEWAKPLHNPSYVRNEK